MITAAEKKIQYILQNSYSTENYVLFVQELFDNVKLVAPNKFNKEYTNFSFHIEGSSHVGYYTAPDNKKLIIASVKLKRDAYIKNSRSTQRSYAKVLIENGNCDAALIAFYTEGEPRWRLSFVRLDYELKVDNGKVKMVENMTPAKRYSFLVGKDEPCHTAVERFRHFVADENYHPTLDELEEAFSVEAVTKEFFNLYCEKFKQLLGHLEDNPDFVEEAKYHNFTAAQFAKKLLGQIVFLYFLQKKGWLGVNTWPDVMNEKAYKKAFFKEGKKSRDLLPLLYTKVGDGTYRRNAAGFKTLNKDDETSLANCVIGKPWGSGPKDFMRRLFNVAVAQKANFFDDYLEPLFYNALNVNRGEQSYAPDLHCRIPFLSGGLFEPIDGYDWKNNNFAIPNEVFSNREGDNHRTGDGILDIFDRYNFTMSEDEPLEREVAVDPEMLGKVFENLLEVKDRKAKGAFYTPREIVHYMCQESLINYLQAKVQVNEQAIRDFILYGDFMKDEDTIKEKRQGKGEMLISSELFKVDNGGKIVVNKLLEIDKALQEIRVADPAVGSGAFPLGMLNEIVRARQNISAYLRIGMTANQARIMYSLERSPYTLKHETIRNCIFAADIEPSAVDIARLRLWLALVIDDNVNPNAHDELDGHINPLPLPNLECNIVCGNSLLDEFEGVPLINKSELIGTATKGETNFGMSVFEPVLKKLIATQDELFKCDDTRKKQSLLETITSLKDELILNQFTENGASKEVIEKYHQSKELASKPYVLWQIDFARVFREKGGFDVVIGNPPYISAQSQKANQKLNELRTILSKNKRFKSLNSKWDIYIPFMELGLQLLAENACESMIIPYPITNQIYAKKFRKMITSEYDLVDITDFKGVKVFDSATVTNCITFIKNRKYHGKTNISRYVGNNIKVLYQQSLEELIRDKKTDVFSLDKDERLINNFSDYHVLGDYCYLSYGLRPNSDEKLAKGEFVKADLISEVEDDIPRRRYIEAKDIEKYKINRVRYLEYGTERSPSKLTRPTFKELYNCSKLVFNVLGDLTGAIDSENKYIHNHSLISCVKWIDLRGIDNKSINGSIKKYSNISRAEMERLSQDIDLKYILAIMNSKMVTQLLKDIRSGDYHIYPEHLRNIPIPPINDDIMKNEIVTMVDAIIKRKILGEDTRDLEVKIDQYVYQLYGLSTTQIQAIERSV